MLFMKKKNTIIFLLTGAFWGLQSKTGFCQSMDSSLEEISKLPRKDVFLDGVMNTILGQDHLVSGTEQFPVPLKQNTCDTLYTLVDNFALQMERCKNGYYYFAEELYCTGDKAQKSNMDYINNIYEMIIYYAMKQPTRWLWSIVPDAGKSLSIDSKKILISELAQNAHIPQDHVFVFDAPNPYTSKDVGDVKAVFKTSNPAANKRYEFIAEYFKTHPNPKYDNDPRKVDLFFSKADPTRPVFVTGSGLQFCDLLAGHGYIDVEFTWNTFTPHSPLPKKIAADIYSFKETLEHELGVTAFLSPSEAEQAAIAGFLAGQTLEQGGQFEDANFNFISDLDMAALFSALFSGGESSSDWLFNSYFTQEQAKYITMPQLMNSPAEKLVWRYQYSSIP